MKKCFQLTFVFLLTVGLLTQCQAPVINERVATISKNTSLRKLQEKMMVEILMLAKEDQFRQFVLKECLKQKHGDYNVYVRDIISAYSEIEKYKKSMNTLTELVGFIKPLVNNTEPLVFYPRAETIEDGLTESPEARISEVVLLEPLGVIQPEEDTDGLRINSAPEGVDAFRVNIDGTWTWVQVVDEEFAWENDVFVIGSDESVEVYDEMRMDGGAEYAGLIQVTNLNAVEHWTSGKLEFKVVVVSSAGTEVSVRKFPKTKRKYFKDNKWFDFDHSLGNWNKSTFGNWMIENWWERDGGGSSTSTISIPSTNGGPAIAHNVNHGSWDNDLGKATVQFTDPVEQLYQISYMNFKRKF